MKKMIPAGIAMVLIVILGAIGTKMGVLEKYSYSQETMDLNEYFQILSEESVPIVLENEVISSHALYRNDIYYFSLSMVKEQLNSRFYYDADNATILYTTELEVYSFPLNSTQYLIDGIPQSAEHSIAVLAGEEPYLSVEFLNDYANFTYEIFENPNRMQLYLEDASYETATIKKDTALRYQGGIKSDVLCLLSKGDKVTILETMDTWTKVKSSDALIGYVENKRLSEEKQTETISVAHNYTPKEYANLCKDYKICLGWHQVTNETANGMVGNLLENAKGLNTISPTWFYVQDEAGTIHSLASQEYVDAMHARGIEVWALVDDFTQQDLDTTILLKNTQTRNNMITQLVGYVQAYGIDGINVDFEHIKAEAGEDYIQFLRELSIACRKNGIILSVDNYVPANFNAFYNRKEQGQIADYVIIMGYDEHYAGSEEAGSVASIGYVEQGIIDTVADVPAHKVINGVPFYTRIWDVTGAVSSEAVGMQSAKDFIAKYDAEAAWDDEVCQNVAHISTDEKNYSIWLEDAQSIRAKLSVMKAHDIGGVAAWKLGFETADIWDLMQEYVSGGAASVAVEETEETPAE